MTRRNGPLASTAVSVARRLKGDETFDIDPAIRMSDLIAFVSRRGIMAIRGALLAARCRSWVAPVFVGRGVHVTGVRHLRLSPGVTIDDYCRLDCLGHTGVSLGRGVTIRRGTQIEVTSVMRELGHGITIEARAGVSEGCFIAAKGPVAVGAETIIGPGTRIIAENHVFLDRNRTIQSQGVTREGITIGTDCWLGAGTTVLDGVRIGNGAVVGAGAVVNRDVEEYTIVAGVPAQKLRPR